MTSLLHIGNRFPSVDGDRLHRAKVVAKNNKVACGRRAQLYVSRVCNSECSTIESVRPRRNHVAAGIRFDLERATLADSQNVWRRRPHAIDSRNRRGLFFSASGDKNDQE